MIRIKNNSRYIYNLLIAIVLMTPIYICFFRDLFHFQTSLTTLIIMAIILILLIWNIVIFKSIQINIICFLYIMSLLILFFSSLENNFNYNYTLIQFGFYVLLPCILGMQNYNGKDIMEYIMLLSIPIILGINEMLIITNYGLNQFDMYTTYTFLVPILASFIHFVFYRKVANVIIKISYLLNFFYTIKVLIGAVRGFWLSLLIGIVLTIVLYYKYNKSVYKYYILIYLISISFLLFILNAQNILQLIYDLFESVFNLKIGFFIKMSELISSANVLNGRDNIYSIAINYINHNLILGYGMNSIYSLTNGYINYPHNFIIQMILDSGLILFIPLIISIVNCLFNLFKTKDVSGQIIFLLYLFLLTIPQSLLSGSIWQNANLWLLVSIGLSNITLNKRLSIQKMRNISD